MTDPIIGIIGGSGLYDIDGLEEKIWKVFAHRGMGYFAGSLNGNDTAPGASFDTPPTGSDVGALEGTVTDSVTGDPIEGVTVTIAFFTFPLPPVDSLCSVTATCNVYVRPSAPGVFVAAEEAMAL